LLKFIKAHPLASVLIVAMALRLVAVFYSQGFIHSDDHFDTVDVSFEWLRSGLWGQDGFLHWKGDAATTIVRFPLYTLSLYAVMETYRAIGITSLDTMMYGVRLLHALLSLLPVWAIFRIVRRVSGSDDWAILGGLMVALHFAMPFFGVRNLIEMVSGDIWILAIYYLYRYRDASQAKWLYLAGLASGLAWMMRLQMAFAIFPIPFVLWYENRHIRPAMHYTLAVLTMLLISGIADKYLLGYFGASTVNNLNLNVNLGPRYETIPLLYPVVLMIFFVPPFSLVLLFIGCRWSFLRRHLLLATSSLCFIVGHMFHANQQERFMIPIVPALMLLAILALYDRYQEKGYILKSRKLFNWLWGVSLAINLILLVPFTVAYGHKGLIEPLKWMQHISPQPRVLFVQPEVKRWIPINYAGLVPPPHVYLRQWSDFDRLRPNELQLGAFDLFILYPPSPAELPVYLDSVESRYGPLTPVRRFQPSFYDEMFHKLNPHHYCSYEAFVYEPR